MIIRVIGVRPIEYGKNSIAGIQVMKAMAAVAIQIEQTKEEEETEKEETEKEETEKEETEEKTEDDAE